MDNSLKRFLNLSLMTITALFAIIALMFYFYRYFTIDTYNLILLIITSITITATVLMVFSVIAILYTYKVRRISKPLVWLVNIGLKILLPFIIYMSGIMGKNKDALRHLYIDINNIIVDGLKKKYLPEDILVILPHCLQNSLCKHKVTGESCNCTRCGGCCIGEIISVADGMGVTVEVVTGGTVARNIISKYKPQIVLCVACERDLASGISDIRRIPVMGVLNERPNGPCYNTKVEVEVIRERLKSIVLENSDKTRL